MASHAAHFSAAAARSRLLNEIECCYQWKLDLRPVKLAWFEAVQSRFYAGWRDKEGLYPEFESPLWPPGSCCHVDRAPWRRQRRIALMGRCHAFCHRCEHAELICKEHWARCSSNTDDVCTTAHEECLGHVHTDGNSLATLYCWGRLWMACWLMLTRVRYSGLFSGFCSDGQQNCLRYELAIVVSRHSGMSTRGPCSALPVVGNRYNNRWMKQLFPAYPSKLLKYTGYLELKLSHSPATIHRNQMSSCRDFRFRNAFTLFRCPFQLSSQWIVFPLLLAARTNVHFVRWNVWFTVHSLVYFPFFSLHI